MLLVVFVLFGYVNESKSAAIEMKLGHFAADSHPGNLASKMFAEGVEKRTNGAIKVIIYPNNALGSPPEVLEQNISGRGRHESAHSGTTREVFQEVQLRHASLHV